MGELVEMVQISQSLILYRSQKIVTKFTRDHFFGPFDIDYQYSDIISADFVVKIASQSVKEHRIVIKVLYIARNSFCEIQEDFHAVYGDSCLSNGAISKWMNCFKDGRETTKDDQYTG